MLEVSEINYHFFQSFICSRSPDIFAITETWLSSSISDNGIIPSGYHIHRNNRGAVGRGVMIGISDSFPSYLISNNINISTEMLL